MYTSPPPQQFGQYQQYKGKGYGGGKAKGGKGKGGKGGKAHPPAPSKPADEAKEGAILLAALKKFGPKFLPAELMKQVENAVPAEPTPPVQARATWQEIQSLKDKIKYADGALDKLDNQVSEAKTRYHDILKTRDNLISKREEQCQRLQQLKDESIEPEVKDMSDWINELLHLASNGIHSIDPEKLHELINHPPATSARVFERRHEDFDMGRRSTSTSPEPQDGTAVFNESRPKEGNGSRRVRSPSLESLHRGRRTSRRDRSERKSSRRPRSSRSRSSPPLTPR